MDTIIKVRENRLNEFNDAVINHLSKGLEEKFNHGEYMEPVRRPNYDLITGASSVEINRLLSQFIPVLEELNKNEDIRKQLLRSCVFLNNTKHHNGSVHMFIWQFKQSQQASVQEQPQQAFVQLQQQQLRP